MTSLTLHASPLRIWSALTDVDHRRAWSPVVSIDDPSRIGATRCTLPVPGLGRPVRAPAHVDLLDKPHGFAWSCGIPYLFTFEERYDLAGDDGGTRLTHSLSLDGALSFPLGGIALRRAKVLMAAADDRFSTYLRWRAGQHTHGIDRQRVPARYRRKAR